MKKTGQLTYEKRVKLQAYLEDEIPISLICKKIGVSKQTVYREIKRNSKRKPAKKPWTVAKSIKCKFRTTCPFTFDSITKKRLLCFNKCEKYEEEVCEIINKFPFVCNKCPKRGFCQFEGKYYYADYADNQAKTKLSESRKILHISEQEFEYINGVISPLIIENRQSLHHIMVSHPEINVTERTVRNWLDKGYTSAKSHFLPRKVRYSTKKDYQKRIIKPRTLLENRTYRDFKKYKNENPSLLVSQFDTVVGLITDKQRILTIHFPAIHFQFGVLLTQFNAQIVVEKLLELREKIGIHKWKSIFPIILCDNGLEFNNLPDVEVDNFTGEVLSRVFYTDPYRSNQKAECERNHEYFRYILPKKNSFDQLTQNDVNLIFSHINCTYRPSLPGVRPYELALQLLGKEFLDIIGIFEIEPEKILLSKKLIK